MGRPLEETELVERARAGDTGAYAALVRGHEEIAFRTAYLITGNAADAEDAAQEGLSRPTARSAASARASRCGPGCSRSSPTRRATAAASAGRRAALALRAAGEERPSGEAAPSPEAALLAGERRAALLAAIGRLREDDRTVIGCRYLLELSEAETAAALGVRPGHGQVAPVAGARAAAGGARGGDAVAELHDELLALRAEWPETPDLVDGGARRARRPRRARGAPRPALAARGRRRAARRARGRDGGRAARARRCSSGSG